MTTSTAPKVFLASSALRRCATQGPDPEPCGDLLGFSGRWGSGISLGGGEEEKLVGGAREEGGWGRVGRRNEEG